MLFRKSYTFFHFWPILLLVLLTSCSKTKVTSFKDFITINVEDKVDLNTAFFLNDSVAFAGGGKKYHYGYIYSTRNGGVSWNRYTLLNFTSVYSFGFLNDSVGFAGCDRLNFEKTKDGGKSWRGDGFGSEVPVHYPDRTPIVKYKFITDSLWYLIGGDLYNKGLFYKTTNGGESFSFTFFDHELKGMSIANNGTIYISGFGYVGKSVDGGITFEKLKLSGDFFVGIESLNNSDVVSVGNNGGIYKSGDAGKSWEKIQKRNGYFKMRKLYNDLAFYDKKVGVAIGNYGLMSVTSDGGNSWEDFELEGNPHLFSVQIKEEKLIIASEDGNIIIIKVNSII